MYLGYAIVLLISLSGVFASAGKPCCNPSKMSGEKFIRGHKYADFFIDYDRNLVVEDWHGMHGTNYIVYDLTDVMRYRLKADGSCSGYPMRSPGRFQQCSVPDDAEEKEVGEDYIIYSYTNGRSRYEKTVDKEDCLPLEVKLFTPSRRRNLPDRVMVVTFTSKVGVPDESIFNIDISHCN